MNPNAHRSLEIERKFLVHAGRLPPRDPARATAITQGYLSFQPSVRVRLSEPANAAARGYLTVKGPGAVSRAEFEYTIPADDARAMLPLCAATLTKVRHAVTVGAHTWDLDEFTGPHAGLWLAEVELADEAESFERPTWLGDEVSRDGRYTNGALARAGRAP